MGQSGWLRVVYAIVRLVPEMDMHSSWRHPAFALLLASLAAGCANVDAVSKEQGAKAETDRAKAPALSQQRLMLSAGYSML